MGRKRPAIFGLLIGAAFLTRPPLAFVGPVFALWYLAGFRERGLTLAQRAGCCRGGTGAGSRSPAPAFAFFLLYNDIRFGSADGVRYALALFDWLAALRDQGRSRWRTSG